MGTKSKPADIFDANYPARRVLNLIGDKWTPIVLYCLSGGVRRFNELQRHIPDVSKKMLIQVLRNLETSGLVDRKVYPVVPPKTEYALTPLGRTLIPVLEGMYTWAEDHFPTVEQARQQYDTERHSGTE